MLGSWDISKDELAPQPGGRPGERPRGPPRKDVADGLQGQQCLVSFGFMLEFSSALFKSRSSFNKHGAQC